VRAVDEQQLIDRVRVLSGLQEPAELVRLLEATARALAACITQPDRQRWAATLPRPMRELFLATPYDGAQRTSDVYAAVTRCEGVSARLGIEHAQAAIRALASDLPADLAELLARHLPTELAEFLTQTSRPHAVAASHVAPPPARHGGAISSAAPGSTHPLAEARPSGAQSGSVAGWDERRMEQSLGSGLGPAADVPGLAEDRPGSKRSIAGDD
jgi:uncharacterized protein (DUF2267 family)